MGENTFTQKCGKSSYLEARGTKNLQKSQSFLSALTINGKKKGMVQNWIFGDFISFAGCLMGKCQSFQLLWRVL